MTVTSSVEATVSRSGATTLPVKKLFGIARELSVSEIELEVDEKNVCTLRSGPSFFKIRGLGAEEFPPLPTFKEEKKVALPQGKLEGHAARRPPSPFPQTNHGMS